MDSLKVCMVTTAFPRWRDDSRGPSMMETARALREVGMQVRVIAMHAPGARGREVMEGVEVIRPRYLWPDRLQILQNEGGGLPAVWEKRPSARWTFLPFFLAQWLAVMRHARGCQVIHAHWTLSGISAWLSRPAHGLPIVLTVHGSDVFRAARLPLVGGLTRRMLNNCRRVIAVSQSLADATIALGLEPRQVEVLPDGIDLDRFLAAGPDRPHRLLYVGSLIERKGVEHLIRAMPAVLARLPQADLVVVGDGPQRASLEALAHRLEVAGRVRFVGAQSQAQVAQWMKQAKAFVLPSLEEALGIVLLEALASGTPCIASRVGGIPEVVTPEVGRLVPPANSHALAQAILEVVGDPVQWAAMHQQARRQAVEKCLTWKKVAARLVEIYRASLN